MADWTTPTNFAAEEIVTSTKLNEQVIQDLLHLYEGRPRRYSETIATAQTTSGGTELTLATLNIPAQDFAYELDVCMFATFQPDSTDDVDVRIKVGGVTKAASRYRGAGTNQRWTHAITCIEPTDVAVNTAATVTVTIQRGSGSGTTSTVQHAGRVTATLFPQVS